MYKNYIQKKKKKKKKKNLHCCAQRKWNILKVNIRYVRKPLKILYVLPYGSNMIFYALASAGPRWRCWNPSLKGEGFNTPDGYSRYQCIRKACSIAVIAYKHFVARKRWENCFKKFFFPVPIMARKSTLPANVLKTPLPGQRLKSSWRHEITFTTVHVTDDDVSFLTVPECWFVKPQSRALTAREFPC